ncbi:MAG: AI-2E family transporter [Microcystaceae cyanobacterium]
MENSSKITNFIIRSFVVGMLLASCFVLIRPFLLITIWSIILAIAAYPVFLWLKDRIGGRSKLAVTLMAIAGIAVIIGPVSVIATITLNNAQTLMDSLEAGTFIVPPPPQDLAGWPLIGDTLNAIWQRASVNLDSVISQFKPQIQNFAKVFFVQVTNVSVTLLKFIISIIVAAVLIIYSEGLTKGLKQFLARLSPKRSEEFIYLMANTIRSVTRGIIGVALIQTLLVGIGLVGAGIPAAGILTVASLFLTIIQIGPGLIVLGAIIFAWSNMSFLTALLFTIYMIPITLVDNILKPILMGKGLPVPIVVILLGVIGGTLAHGIVGLFVGPVILILGYELVKAWVNDGIEVPMETATPENS